MHTWFPDSFLELTLESENLFLGWYCLEVLEILLEKEVLVGGLRG